MSQVWTSECVAVGHPDKIADRISDAVVDEAMRGDVNSRVAVETLVKSNTVYLAGEITTKAELDYQRIVRSTLRALGYSDPKWGFPADDVNIVININEQAPKLNQISQRTAGDQGSMFGYACNETRVYMPLPIMLAREMQIEMRLYAQRNPGRFGPDGKSQVTVRHYDSGHVCDVPVALLSVLHDPEVTREELDELGQNVFRLAAVNLGLSRLQTETTRILVNPDGAWTRGGPQVDAGVTGRKIIVDTYGGRGHHGGGAFSGKDPSKLDRTGAYAARYLAKHICRRFKLPEVSVQLAYVIGEEQPVSIWVSGMDEVEARKAVHDQLPDLSPTALIERFQLKTPGKMPIYSWLASGGHFGIPDLPWEKL
jgi:S-adenosylmethionine synthetase